MTALSKKSAWSLILNFLVPCHRQKRSSMHTHFNLSTSYIVPCAFATRQWTTQEVQTELIASASPHLCFCPHCHQQNCMHTYLVLSILDLVSHTFAVPYRNSGLTSCPRAQSPSTRNLIRSFRYFVPFQLLHHQQQRYVHTHLFLFYS